MSQLQRRRKIEGEDGVRLKKHFESVREGIQLVYNRFTKGYKNVATATAAVAGAEVKNPARTSSRFFYLGRRSRRLIFRVFVQKKSFGFGSFCFVSFRR